MSTSTVIYKKADDETCFEVEVHSRRLSGGPIPTAILDALPDHPHTAAVCAALLHEVK